MRLGIDTGATVSLLKLKMLKDNTRIYEEKIKLTRITGHSITTIEKTYATILLMNKTIKHPIYIVKDENSMEYDGILGTDFIRKNKISCNYGTKEVRIGSTSFKLFLYRQITLKPRNYSPSYHQPKHDRYNASGRNVTRYFYRKLPSRP